MIADPIQADEYIAAAEEVLSVDPTLGMLVDGERGVWALPMAPADAEQVTLYYTFTRDEVLFLFIQASA